MTAPFTQEHRLPADTDLEREIRAELANRLAGESPLSELVHVVLSLIAAAVIWPAVPNTQAIAWAFAISMAALLRGLLRARRRKDSADPFKTQQTIRLGVGLLTIAWGVGIAFIGPTLPFELLALLTIIMAGVVAGATIALLADPFSFRVMAGGLLAPIALAIAVNGDAHHNRIGAVLVLIFGASMLVYYRRSHTALRKQLEMAQALRITTAQAQAERNRAERMVRIVESTTDLVVIAEPEGKLLYINKAGRAMLGMGPQEDVSQLSFRDTSPPRLHEVIERELLPTILKQGTWSGESTVLSRDGREIPVSAVAIAHRRPFDEKVDSISAVARDVTVQTAARNALQAARDSAEQMAAAKSAFLANTSHEIRTPLNGILGMVELLLDTELTPAQRRSVELIATSGETLLNTINDVLDLSKIEAGQMELEQVPFDLHHLVHSAVRLLNTRVGDKSVELVSDVGSDVPQRVIGDPHRLRQVLTNLIGNAIKFTHEGEVVVSVGRVSGNGRACIRLGVRDTGIGIKPEHVERIFQPFRQVDASTTRHYGGTGLGLSISRRLVSMMGGELAVDSTPGKGSEFHFTVEWEVAADSGAETQRTRGSLRGIRALVVDDHPVNRRILADMLRWAGSEAQEVASVDDALARLREASENGAPIPLVVSDVQMPDRDGFDLAGVLKSDAALQQIRIMLLTSAGRPGDDQKCRDLGVAAYMQKPVSRVELVEAALAALSDGAGKSGRRTLVTRIKLDETRPRLRILIAEDNPVNQEVAATMLRQRGHDVEIVDNGREAVDAVQRSATFDVVLMDIQMPEMDGVSATRAIRAMGATKPPIVALTASVSNEERERCLDAGMNGYLAKPFKPHELFAIVEGWLPDEPAVPAEDDESRTPVDLDGFNAMLTDAGIPEAGGRMIDAFLQDAPTRIAEMLDAADAEDLSAVSTLAHRVASGAGSIFAQDLSRLLRETEDAASAGSLAHARATAQKAADEFARVQEYLVKSSGLVG